MALTFSDFDSYRLTTEFNNDCYTHTIPSGPGTSGSTRELVRTEKWSRVGQVGKGAFGTVWKEECAQNGAVRAVKQIPKSHIRVGEVLALKEMTLYPQYFVEFFGWFLDEENIYLAMEYFECGDLGQLIKDDDLSENDIKSVATQLLEGLKIMHENNFCHRDLKPNNILIVKWIPLVVKIGDFGIAKHVGGTTELRTFAGSPGYVAPEVWGYLDSDTSKYTNAVDIWSLGCLVYAMITKETPFPETLELLEYIHARISFPETKLKSKASTATRFITSLMKPRPQDRLTAGMALEHPWLEVQQEDITFWTELPNAVIEGSSELGLDLTVLNVVAAAGSELMERPKVSKGITLVDSNGFTSLHRAVLEGYVDVVQLLLERGADIMAKTNYGFTALHWAAFKGHTEVAELLLDRGADIMARATSGATPLTVGAGNGHKEILCLLLDRGADIMTSADDGLTALHWAAHMGHTALAQLLLERGADIMVKDGYGMTALHLAARNGFLEMSQLLLEGGADMMARTPTGAIPLVAAVQKAHTEVVRLLLDRGADITAKAGDGLVALHWAAYHGYTEVAQLLLERGADIMAVDNWGFTSLHRATIEGNMDVVQLLLEGGADIMAKSNEGFTTLHWAAHKGNVGVARLLLEGGADIMAKEKLGYTALHLAAHQGYQEMTQLLLERGADIMARTGTKATPLILASQQGHKEVVRLLLDWDEGIAENTHGPGTSVGLQDQSLAKRRKRWPFEMAIRKMKKFVIS